MKLPDRKTWYKLPEMRIAVLTPEQTAQKQAYMQLVVPSRRLVALGVWRSVNATTREEQGDSCSSFH